MTASNEASLIREIRLGNSKAFAQLVDEYKYLVYTLAFRMIKDREEAEEVSQDAFVKVYRSIDSFKGDCKISTWIYRITYNTCLDKIGQNNKNRTFVNLEDQANVSVANVDNALDQLIAEERGQVIKKCLGRLPSKDTALLTLFYLEEKNLQEIEEILDVSVDVLKVRLFRARKKLATIFESRLIKEKLQDYG
ncbi:RNA polymerase sigma factor [Flagellimonas sp.]|uniref:RNA polymerase sigma factor n=1 Tax=Flagellimonas sp. TaxID=2058762 RepID=UPI003B515113